MTFVAAITSPDSIWIVADRRLSIGGRRVRDDARKLFCLETQDGVALLGYAGLGMTHLGVEPSDWMSRTLRGRNLPLEQSLGVLAEAAKNRLPRYIDAMSRQDPRLGAHHILAAAFQKNEPRIYSIDMVNRPEQGQFRFRFTRHVAPAHLKHGQRAPFVAIGGSGAIALLHDRRRIQDLRRVIKAHDRGKITANAVAAHLARLNYSVHLRTADRSVGPSCIVLWRFNKEGRMKGGGGIELFNGTERDRPSKFVSVPTITNGMDLSALIGVLMPRFTSMKPGEDFIPPDMTGVNDDLAKLPDKPDDRL